MTTRPAARDRRLLTALRLAAQGIAHPSLDDPVQVVRGMLALQGQDYLGALWSVGLRTPAATEADVEAAHASGAIVRSWPQRGTLHLVAAEDLGWMLSLTGERTVRSAAGRHRELGLDSADFARAAAIARERLGGGGRAERAELLAAFVAGGVSVEGQRGAHLLGNLAHTGLIVLCGRTEYALLEEHAREPRRLEPDAAAEELAWRYFAGHGPATVRDLAWWSGLPLTLVREATARVRDRLEALEVDGVEYLMRPGLEPDGDGVHALPGFDEYLLGYTDRTAALAPEHADTIVPGGNGMFLPTMVVRGEVVGTWKRERGRRAVRVTRAPFSPLSGAAERGFAKALQRYGRFLESELEVN
ncbi:MAG: winged helix DNA-binding domain-containing protein [Protaetiibacter sp.]